MRYEPREHEQESRRTPGQNRETHECKSLNNQADQVELTIASTPKGERLADTAATQGAVLGRPALSRPIRRFAKDRCAAGNVDCPVPERGRQTEIQSAW